MPAVPLVLVDAWNVVRARWPNFAEERFLELTRLWAEREEVHAVVVFDGAREERELDERTRVVGTGAGSADDWIAGRAERGSEPPRPLWIVTSDRELRRRVAPFADRTIGGGAFAGELERLEAD